MDKFNLVTTQINKPVSKALLQSMDIVLKTIVQFVHIKVMKMMEKVAVLNQAVDLSVQLELRKMKVENVEETSNIPVKMVRLQLMDTVEQTVQTNVVKEQLKELAVLKKFYSVHMAIKKMIKENVSNVKMFTLT